MNTQTAVSPRRVTALAADPLLFVEVTAFAMTATVAAGFARVFDGWGHLRSMLIAAAVCHLTVAIVRRRGRGVAVSLAASVLGLAVTTGVTLYRSTTWHLLPTRSTWDVALAQLRDSWHHFVDVTPLIAPKGGYLLAAVLGVWLIAFATDAFAVRMRAGVEAVVPSAIMFVICSMMAAPRDRVGFAAAQVAATLAFLAAHRVWTMQTSAAWLTGDRRSSAGSLARITAVLSASALLVALLAGPALPGAGQGSVVDYKPASGGAVRFTVSPLVDLRGRIASQSRAEAFRVRSTTASYWRLTTLNAFDGVVWTGETKYTQARAGSTLPGGPPAAFSTEVTQDFLMTGLQQEYLPVANTPVRIEGVSGFSYAKATGSVLLDEGTTAPHQYRVVSREPKVTEAALREAEVGTTKEIDASFFALPTDLPGQVAATAAQWTAGATTSYDKLRALQDTFRSTFRYSLNPRLDPRNPLTSFLTIKVGYCEQFAGMFAAMARTLGLPSRVAVGFTQGVAQPDGTFVVQGRHAHAWPEVYFKGIGWVPFEPTPSRGIPGAQDYTGVAAAQEGEPPAGSPTTTVAPEDTTTTVAAADANSIPVPTEARPEGDFTFRPVGHRSVAKGIALTGSAVLVALVGWVVSLAMARRIRRRRRWDSATSDPGRIAVVWGEVTELLARAGVVHRAAQTPLEFAGQAPIPEVVDRASLTRLANVVTVAGYAPELPVGAFERARVDADRVEAQVDASFTWRDRVRWAVLPGRLGARRERSEPLEQ